MENQTSGMSIASLVLGIIGLVIGCCHPVIALVCSIVGLVLGINGYKYSKTNFALAGIVVCVIAIILALILWILYAIVGSVFKWILLFLGLA